MNGKKSNGRRCVSEVQSENPLKDCCVESSNLMLGGKDYNVEFKKINVKMLFMLKWVL